MREGFVKLKNPFNRKEVFISLKKEEILGFVFWSKNFKPLLKYLKEIEEYSDKFHFHFTINFHPKEIEPLPLDFKEIIKTFEFLSKKYGKGSLSWRFDPILPSSIYPFKEQIKNFKKVGKCLKGMTERCITSFMFPYGKVKRRIKFLEDSMEKKGEILRILRDEAENLGIKLFLCSSNPSVEGVEPSKCIDGLKFFNVKGKKSPTRKGCNCDFSLDLGIYGTCKSKCIYCYAT